MTYFQETLIKQLPYIITFIVIILVTFFIAYLVRKSFNQFIQKISEKDGIDPTNYSFLRYIVVALVYIIGFLMAMYSVPILRSVGSTLLAGAGVLALAVSFASQQALSNIISGLFIVIFKPFRINDRLSIKDKTLSGVVEAITVRHTIIRDLENRRIIVPNSVISDEVIINSDYGGGAICKWVELGISYDSDIDLAKKIMSETATAHPLYFDARTTVEKKKGIPAVIVRVVSLGDSSVNLRAWVWAKNQTDGFVLQCDLLEQIKKKFDASGVDIPFPHRTIINKPN